ncbi:MAG TPA: hypothetical protein VFN87_18670, partial [Solirubrobacteraceae bacterium]|nr:hypothetical protein [Solirubrobacteraceae bacterium]
LFEAIPFPVGYGVEIAVLIDALRIAGLDALAECHLGTRQNRHQPLRALGEMAYAVLAAVERRRGGDRADGDSAENRRGGEAAGVPAVNDAPPAGHYLKPWENGAVAAVPVAERPPVRDRRAAEATRRLPAPAS